MYNNREVQTQFQTESISDAGVKWIALRMLQRGRYTRFVALKDGGHWDFVRDSELFWELPTWWSLPWNRPPNHPRSEQSRGRRPLLPKEWHRNQDRRRGHSSVARNQPARPSTDRSRSRERPPLKPSAVAATPDASVPVAVGKNRRRKRAKTTKADLKGGSAQSSTFRFAALHVTSLFSDCRSLCSCFWVGIRVGNFFDVHCPGHPDTAAAASWKMRNLGRARLRQRCFFIKRCRADWWQRCSGLFIVPAV